MIDWEKELQEIFADPLLADVTPSKKKVEAGDRLETGFQRILEFAATHHRLPRNEGDRTERALYNQLQGILNDPKKKNRCLPLDTRGILSAPTVVAESEMEYATTPQTEAEALADIWDDPIFTDAADTAGLFDLPDYMKKKLEERREADYVAQRVKCEDFPLYEPGFKEVHAGLKSGKYQLIKFRDAHIAQGRYFVDDGTLIYIAALDQVARNRHGRKDSRTRCIYETGMESGIYMQTLCKNLYTSGYTVQDVSQVEENFLQQKLTVTHEDVASGWIYVLRSLSSDPEIRAIPNLYKIGFTTTPVETRIAHAPKEATYLCADVQVVATWIVYNVKASTFEALIHKLFDCVQLQVKVDGKTPKEWFSVPLHVIEQAVLALTHGKPIIYDPQLQQLVYLPTE